MKNVELRHRIAEKGYRSIYDEYWDRRTDKTNRWLLAHDPELQKKVKKAYKKLGLKTKF